MNIIVRHLKIGLYVIGAWPGVSSANFFFALISAFMFSLIFQLWNLTKVIYELNYLMNNLGTTMPLTSVLLKLSVFRFKYESVKLVINEMLKDWKGEKGIIKRKVMIKNTRIAIYLSNAIAISYNGLIIAYLLIAVLSYNGESIDDRQYVMQATFPINAKKSPIFEIVCILQFIVTFFGANGHAVMEGLLTVSVLHANTKALGVCQEISKFSYICQTDKSRKHVLKAKEKLIKTHLNFINFTEWIQDIYAYISFFHLFVMTLINCIVGYMFINLASINGADISTLLLCIAYMFTALSAVASYCIAGEYLTSQGTLIFMKLYDCPWYQFKPVDAKIIVLMLMRSRQPVTITAGSFGNLSLVYFSRIIKTSVSYLSLVRAASI